VNFIFDDESEKKLLSLMAQHFGVMSATNGAERFLELKNYLAPMLKEASTFASKKIIIAGTNGKGETAHCLNYLFESSGKKTALWTSPHILSLRERFYFQGENLSYSELESALQEEFLEQKKSNIVLGYYETLFASFLRVALKKKPEILILEVGLGGRFDAVNLLTPDLSLITSIARDHEEILGRGHRRILLEKLGITRKNGPLLSCLELAYQREICREYCDNNDVPWEDFFGLGLLLKKDHYSLRNRFLALKAFEKLEGHSFNGTWPSDLSFKGRGERLDWEQGQFYFIGAHNHDGVRKMLEGLKTGHLLNDFSFPFDTIVVSFSKRSFEEIEACLRLIKAESYLLARRVVLTTYEHPKAMDAETLSKFKGLVEFAHDWKKIIPSLKGPTLVTGSYYFIGEIQRHFCLSSSSSSSSSPYPHS